MLKLERPRKGLIQTPVRVDARWQQYAPKVVLTPAWGLQSAVSGLRGAFANDARLANGAFEFPGVNGYIDLGTGALVTDTAHTLLVVCQLDSFPTNYPILTTYQTSAAAGMSVFFSDNAAYNDFSIGSPGSPTARFPLTGSGPVLGTRRAIVVARSANSTAGHAAHVNGTKLAPVASGAHGVRSGNSVIGQTGTASTTNDFDGRIWLFALFDSVLPDPVARALSENPWQLFQPHRSWIPVTAAGGGDATVALTGAATTSSPGVITATGSAAAALVGASTASAAGTVSASASTNATVSLTGAATASAAGTAAATGGAAVTVAGAKASSAAGTAAAAGDASTAITGASTASAAGTTTATAGGNATATLVGSSTASAAGTMAATGAAIAAVTGAASASAAGTVDASIGTNATVALTGAAVIASAGALVVSGAAQIVITGAGTAASAGTISAAGQADATVALSGAAAVAACGTIAAVGGVAGTGATAAEIWAHVMADGRTAEAVMLDNARMMRIILGGVSGRTIGAGSAHERFLSEDGSKVRIEVRYSSTGDRATVDLDGSL